MMRLVDAGERERERERTKAGHNMGKQHAALTQSMRCCLVCAHAGSR